MLPKLHSSDSKSLELIRPLYYIRETSIKSFIAHTGIPAMNCGCKVASGQTPSKRKEVKELIARLKETNPNVDKSIFKATENANLDALLGYEMQGVKHHFLDFYHEDMKE
ncbi:MAG: hypothetical protein ACRC1P_02080, partial [Cellulosilyticaceae bacterium]